MSKGINESMKLLKDKSLGFSSPRAGHSGGDLMLSAPPSGCSYKDEGIVEVLELWALGGPLALSHSMICQVEYDSSAKGTCPATKYLHDLGG